VKARKKRKNSAPAHALSWRSTNICIALSLLLALVGAPLVVTFVEQIRDLIPQLQTQVTQEAYQVAGRALAKELRILNLRQTFKGLALPGRPGPVKWDSLRRSDPSNGIYIFLELLEALWEHEGIIAKGMGSEVGEAELRIEQLLQQALNGNPSKIYTVRQREVATSGFRSAGLSPRRSAVEAERIRRVFGQLQEWHRRVLRELADRLMADRQRRSEHAQTEVSHAGAAAVVRLFTDLVRDSPTPDIALLAAEKLPASLRELGADTEADRIASFTKNWHDATSDDQVNHIPHTGNGVVARVAHDRMMRSFLAVALSLISWLVLTSLLFALLPIALTSARGGGTHLVWRLGDRGPLTAGAMVCFPMFGLLLFTGFGNVPFAWLLSAPSLQGALFWPPLLIIVVLLASRLCVRSTDERMNCCTLPLSAVWAAMSVLLLTVMAGPFCVDFAQDVWRPPAGIQLFRRVGWVLGMESVVLGVIWIVWSFVRLRRARLPVGIRARAVLTVTAVAWLAVSGISLVSLAINQLNDHRHQQAFAVAACDPVADRLGPNWPAGYFEGARLVPE